MKRIEIVVDTKGNSQVQTKGFSGPSCLDASRFIREALGKQNNQRKTAEFYAAGTQQTQQSQKGS